MGVIIQKYRSMYIWGHLQWIKILSLLVEAPTLSKREIYFRMVHMSLNLEHLLKFQSTAIIIIIIII